MDPKLQLLAMIQAATPDATPPQETISNGAIRATLHLPNPEKGYYRGTRFDWSGQISSLEYRGHNYFGKWFERYDAKLHDAITKTVQMPDIQQKFATFGVIPKTATPQKVGQMTAEEITRWTPVIRDNNIRAD